VIYLSHRTIALVALIVAASAAGVSAQAPAPVVNPPDPATVVRAAAPIAWVGSFELAKRSAATNQVIVVDVSTSWCTWCRYMESKVYPDAAVRELASGNVFVRIDPKDHAEGEAFAKKEKVKAYPTIFVFSSGGKLLRKQVGAFDTGNSFVAWIREAAASH
jgi:thiol:disulfide interchange protein